MTRGGTLLDRRLRWQTLDPAPRDALRITVLAGYTADPLVPYLGLALHEAGLSARIEVGPYDRIAQECLDDASATARARPHVLVAWPRLTDDPDPAAALREVLEAAADAARRWEAVLVALIPPQASAAARAVARRPGVEIVELHPILQECGGDEALHPEMYRLAKIPYREPVFARAAEEIADVLRQRSHGPVTTVVLDLTAGALTAVETAAARELAEAGARLTVRPGVSTRVRLPSALADLDVELAGEELGPGTVLHIGQGVTEAPAGVTRWRPGERLPRRSTGSWADSPGATAVSAARRSVQDYIASLQARITPVEVTGAALSELVARTTEFTLGGPPPVLTGPGRHAALFHVRDRLGDYGTCAAFALRCDGRDCLVDTFLVSCPALGRGVEPALLDHVAARAAAAGCDRIRVAVVATGKNQIAVDFFGGIDTWRGLALEAVPPES
jgi:hypothetical protein